MDASFISISSMADFLPGGVIAERQAATAANSHRMNGHGSSSVPVSRATSRRSSIEQVVHDNTPQHQAIREAVIKRDAEALRHLSIKGFVHDAMRRLVWPLLLNATTPSLPKINEADILRRRRKLHQEDHEKDAANTSAADEKAQDGPERHRDEYQVELDVNRSFVHLPVDEQRDALRKQLSELIVGTLRRYPALNYFQGYHDIVSIILLVAEDDMDLAHRLTARISLFHIRDSMMTGLDPAIGYLRLLKRILAKADPTLAAAVEQASALPYFSLSWTLTLMAHDLTSVDIVTRIFDFLLAHDPAMVSYLSAAIVMAKKDELDHLDEDLAHDPATLHTVLAKLPQLTTEPLHSHSYPHSHSHSPSSRSVPSSPRVGFSSNFPQIPNGGLPTLHQASSTSLSSLADPDVHVPAFRHSLGSSTGRHRYTRRPSPIPIESLFLTASKLYEAYPLDNPDIDAKTIFGHNSAVFTWSRHDMLEEEAEQIVAEGKDVIIPDVKIDETDDLDRLPVNDKLARHKRQLQIRSLLRTVFVVNRNITIFTLVGITSMMIALYSKDGPFGHLGSRSWLRDNWLVKLCLGKL